MTMEMVESNGARIATYVDGKEDAPWLLLSNSLAADARMWDDQIDLATTTHRVIRYDTRGHGQSDAPQGPYDFGLLVADMVAVLDHYKVERADVMALSLGGMTALGLALDHPERVGSMIVCDARADAPPPFVQSWDQRIAAIRAGGLEPIVPATLERWFTPAAASKRPKALDLARQMILKTSPDGYIACAEALKGLDYLRRLGDMKAAVLYVVGAEDTGAPKEAMAQMADRTPNGRLTVLPDLAHVPNMENPVVFAGAVRAWLASAAAKAG